MQCAAAIFSVGCFRCTNSAFLRRFTIGGADATVESGWRDPSTLLRCAGIVAAASLATCGFIGAVRNDLEMTLFRPRFGVVFLHGPLAWLCFTGMMMMAVGMFRLLGPPFGAGSIDFEERRRRFGWIVLIGVGLVGISVNTADPHS